MVPLVATNIHRVEAGTFLKPVKRVRFSKSRSTHRLRGRFRVAVVQHLRSHRLYLSVSPQTFHPEQGNKELLGVTVTFATYADVLRTKHWYHARGGMRRNNFSLNLDSLLSRPPETTYDC